MKATGDLHQLGQSIWLDNITREMLDSGQLERYIDELFGDRASRPIRRSSTRPSRPAATTTPSARRPSRASTGEELFFELAIDDLRRAADLFRPIHDRTDGVDGWVSLEVSPLLAYDTADHRHRPPRSCTSAPIGRTSSSRSRAPGGPARRSRRPSPPACRSTSRCSSPRDHYVAAAEAYLRGVERRIATGLDPAVASVASMFMSRWDVRRQGPGARRPAQRARPSPSARRPTGPTASCSTPTAGSGSRTRAPARSACSSPAPAPRIPRRRTLLYVQALGGAEHRQHDAREDAAGARRPRRDRRAAGGRRWRQRSRAAGVPAGRHRPGCAGGEAAA